MKAGLFQFILNVYPPYLGTGIHVVRIAPDYREILVEMKLRWYNRNYVRTHFGGSLYAMTDPFFMLMLLQILGKDYIVWDRKATIDFIRPGRGRVQAHFLITDQQIADIISKTVDGSKYQPHFLVDITDTAGERVAQVTKTLYIRRKAPQPITP